MHPANLYRQRIQYYEAEQKKYQRKFANFGLLRLALFLSLVVVTILLWQFDVLFSLGFLFASLIGFGKVVTWHEKLNERAQHMRKLIVINQQEDNALRYELDWNPTGSEYLPEYHPYASDLDIFGAASLFQYTNRASTLIGRNKLADWLLTAASNDSIHRRQEAVAEIASSVDFRQELQALAIGLTETSTHREDLLTWLRSSTYLIDNPMRRTMRWIVLFITLPACLALIYFGLINIGWVPLLLPGYFLWKSKEPIDQIHRQTEHASQTLAIYARLFNHLEAQNWEAQSLKSMARRWVDYKNRPSKWISNLSFAIAQLNVRSNFFAIFFNLFGLWDFHWVYRLEKIKVKIQDELDDWFDILATTEALCSLANLSFNNPEWAIPALSQIHLNATELGHPLISPDRRVCNDLAISQRSDLKLITGSNMAGKSTFLRTVGVNLVLAGAGGPVCASSFEWKPVGIFTSMRTVDALNENASTFYAELSRLKTMLDMVKEQDCLVLLDEILKGTNSGDRHKGSEALIKQLIGWQAIGLIATHDLALTHLEKQFPCRIENWYFDVSIRDDELVFDYQVKRGICQSFNATLLMRKMGIEID